MTLFALRLGVSPALDARAVPEMGFLCVIAMDHKVFKACEHAAANRGGGMPALGMLGSAARAWPEAREKGLPRVAEVIEVLHLCIRLISVVSWLSHERYLL